MDMLVSAAGEEDLGASGRTHSCPVASACGRALTSACMDSTTCCKCTTFMNINNIHVIAAFLAAQHKT